MNSENSVLGETLLALDHSIQHQIDMEFFGGSGGAGDCGGGGGCSGGSNSVNYEPV